MDLRPRRTITLPLAWDEWVLLNGRWPISEANWQALIDLLLVMKVGLVEDPEPEIVPEGHVSAVVSGVGAKR